MKKILILTCNTGEGHNSAAQAVKTALLRRGADCVTADPVGFSSERAKKFVSSFYNNLIRKTPAAFGAMYKMGDLYSSTRLTSPVYLANASYADSLLSYIKESGVDAVVCTHLYGMEAMTAIAKKGETDIPCYGVLTDYTCIPFLAETRLSAYFVPHDEIKRELAEKGIPEERIFASGIPVDARFSEHPDSFSARESLGIEEGKRVFLLMTGGIGCENMVKLCGELVGACRDDGDIVFVLTGRNDGMKSRLDEKYGTDGILRTVPFTRHVETYMSAADVMISKPGGLSSTEAAVVNVPLVFVNAIPGCETCNARFFSGLGIAESAASEKEAVAAAMNLANDPVRSETMRRLQREHINPRAAEEIAAAVMGS